MAGLLSFLEGKFNAPAECIIKVGASGEEISHLYPFLTEVTVETGRENPATATLTFDTLREDDGRWAVQDDPALVPWAPIIIEAAFGDTTEEVMRGFIREVTCDYPSDPGATTVTVSCQDDSIKMDREHIRQGWGNDAPTSDAVILPAILGRHGLSPDPDNGQGQSNLVLNQDDTDIRFLRGRAEANGYELIFSEGTVYFGPMRLETEPQDTIMVYAGPDTHCISFSINDDGHQPDQVAFDRAETRGTGTVTETVESDLPLLGNEPANSSGQGLDDFSWRMSRDGAMSEEEWMARAQRQANELSMKVRATGEMDGSLYGHVLRVAETVGVDGVGERHGGIYYVDTVTHRFSAEGYRQNFSLIRNAYGDNLQTAGGLLSAVLG